MGVEGSPTELGINFCNQIRPYTFLCLAFAANELSFENGLSVAQHVPWGQEMVGGKTIYRFSQDLAI